MPNPFSLFRGLMVQKPAPYGVPDVTPPTFAGLTSATPNDDGSITVNWALATSTKTPIDYHIYIAPGVVSAVTLFNSIYQAVHIPPGKTTGKVFLLADQLTYLVKGQQYTLGVRSNDVYGFEDSNVAIATVTAIASGNLPAIFQTLANQIAATEVLLAQDHTNLAADHVNFQADHANFQSDHSAFQGDHTNFGTDHTNFQSDHTNFQSDITSLNSIVSSLTSSAASISSSASSLASSASAIAATEILLAADVTTLTGQLTTLNGYLSTFNTDLTAFAANNTTYSGLNTTLSGHLTTLANDLTTLAGQLTTFANSNADFVSENADFTASLLELSGLISALQVAVGSAAGLGGLELELENDQLVEIEIIDEEEVT